MKVKITHEVWADVEDVERGDTAGVWALTERARTTIFHAADGWSEVPEPRWENCTGEVEIERIDDGITYINFGGKVVGCFNKGYWPHKADLYALDECALDQLHTIQQDGAGRYKEMSLKEYFAQFRTSAIQIHRHTDGREG